MAAGDFTIDDYKSKIAGAWVLTGTFEADDTARDMTLGQFVRSFSFVNSDDVAAGTKVVLNSTAAGQVNIDNEDGGVDTLAWRAEVIL